MKATVVLFFFLGMSSLLFCINPKDEGIYEDAYMITNAILKVSYKNSPKLYTDKMNAQGSQGSIVCIFYCVFSSDVRMALSKRWYQFKVSTKIANSVSRILALSSHSVRCPSVVRVSSSVTCRIRTVYYCLVRLVLHE